MGGEPPSMGGAEWNYNEDRGHGAGRGRRAPGGGRGGGQGRGREGGSRGRVYERGGRRGRTAEIRPGDTSGDKLPRAPIVFVARNRTVENEGVSDAERLLNLATDKHAPVDSRLQALTDYRNSFRTSPGRPHVSGGSFPSLLEKLMALLADEPPVSDMAAGIIPVLAASLGEEAGSKSSDLDDILDALLKRCTSISVSNELEARQQSAVFFAIGGCFKGSTAAAFRCSTAFVHAMCDVLLKAPPENIRPGLNALDCILKLQNMRKEMEQYTSNKLTRSMIEMANDGRIQLTERELVMEIVDFATVGIDYDALLEQLIENICQKCRELVSHACEESSEALNNMSTKMSGLAACAVPLMQRSLRAPTNVAYEQFVRLLASWAEVVDGFYPQVAGCEWLGTLVGTLISDADSFVRVLSVGEQKPESAYAAGRKLLLRPPGEPLAAQAAPSKSSDGSLEIMFVEAGIRFAVTCLMNGAILEEAALASTILRTLNSWISRLAILAWRPQEMLESGLQRCFSLSDRPLSELRVSTDPSIIQPLARLYVQLISLIPTLGEDVLHELFNLPDDKALLNFDLNVVFAAAKAGLAEELAWPLWKVVRRLLEEGPHLETESIEQKAFQLGQIACAGALEEITPHAIRLMVFLATRPDRSTLTMPALSWLKELVLNLRKDDTEQLKLALYAMKVLLDEYIPKGEGKATQSAVFEVVAASLASPAFALLYNRRPDGFRLMIDFCRHALAAQSGWNEDDAESGRRVLRCASVVLSYSFLNGSAHWTPWENIAITSARNAAVLRQQRQFSASQLSQVLDYVTRAFSGKLLLGDLQEKKDSHVPDDWIIQLVRSMTNLEDNSSKEDAFSRPGEDVGCLRSVLWFYVLNEAAKQCVSSKLSAHWRDPGETFEALEDALRKVAAMQPNTSVAKRHRATCLLLFLFALEQEIWNAAHGSGLRTEPHTVAVMHFAAKEAVSARWLLRLRPIAVQAAEALEAWPFVVFHGLKVLENLDKEPSKAPERKKKQTQIEPGWTKPSEAAIKTEENSTFSDESSTLTSSKREPPNSSKRPLLLLKRSETEESPASALHLSGMSSDTEAASKAGEMTNIRQTQGLQNYDANKEEMVTSVGRALARMHDADAILGMKSFMRRGEVDKDCWSWLDALALHASGRHENALKCLEIVGPTIPYNTAVQRLILETQIESYAAVGDWNGFQEWIKSRPAKVMNDTLDISLPGYLAEWRDQGAPTGVQEKPELGPLLRAVRALRIGGVSEDVLDVTREEGRDLAESNAWNQIRAVAGLATNPDVLTCPGILEAIGTLAGLEIFERPQAYKELLSVFGAATSRVSFDAWNGSSGHMPFPIPVAPTLATLLLSGAAQSGDNAVGPGLPLSAAKAVRAGGNTSYAQRLLLQASRNLEDLPHLQTNVIALEQYLSVDKDHQSADAQTLHAMLTSWLKESTRSEQMSLDPRNPWGWDWRNDVRVRVALAVCEDPKDFGTYGRMWPPDGALFWEYAKYLDGVEGGATQLETVKACCNALRLCGLDSSALSYTRRQQLLPIVYMIARLISDHSTELQEQEVEVSKALESVPPKAWLPLIPHLISQALTSSNPFVKDRAMDALRAAASDSPIDVLYPLFVEADKVPGGASSEHNIDGEALRALLDHCSAQNASLTSQVQEFARGLVGLSMLEDERWHAILREAHAATTKRLGVAYAHLKPYRLPHDASASERSDFVALATEEYTLALAPVLCALRSHAHASLALPSQAAASPHVEEFYRGWNFSARLQWLIDQLEQPLALPSDGVLEAALQRPIQCIKNVETSLRQRLEGVAHIDLASVAPSLSQQKNLIIPVPGSQDETTSIASISPDVLALHTKTRPKKIQIVGSDGKSYSFLVKGREDLRVDASVADFLRAASATLSAFSECDGSLEAAAAILPLVVVPVGRHCGLVGWIDDAQPLFQVYAVHEEHRARRAALLAAARSQRADEDANAKAKSTTKTQTQTQKKKEKKAQKQHEKQAGEAAAKLEQQQQELLSTKQPIDRFHAALTALGVDTSTPRAQWDPQALHKAFEEMASLAPTSMITEELLAGAAGPADWWLRQRKYSTCLATSSILGHLLGLGDRHLDNILLCSVSGAVRHVDFGLLFDRGATLAVPEVVPFRLTQTLVGGLGLTGTEGRFRKAAERTLTSARCNVKSLSTALRLSVQNPLINWMPEMGSKMSRLAIERWVELKRVRDAGSWDGAIHPETIASALSEAMHAFDETAAVLVPFQEMFDGVALAVVAMTDHEASLAKHAGIVKSTMDREVELASRASAAQDKARTMSEQVALAMADVVTCASECRAWCQHHMGVLSALVREGSLEAVAAKAREWDPAMADVPLGMLRWNGGLTLVQVALGVDPSRAPLNPNMLLQTAAVDDAGYRVLEKRATAVRDLLSCLQRYAVAVALLPDYSELSLHKSWLSILENEHWAKSVTSHQQRQLPTYDDLSAEALQATNTWRSLKAQVSCADAVVARLRDTQATLGIERVDMSLAAADAKEHLAFLLADKSVSSAELADALSQFTSKQAAAADRLSTSAPLELNFLDSVQALVLGFARTFLTVRQSLSAESSATAKVPWWLDDVLAGLDPMNRSIQAIGTLLGEVQLVAPDLAGLLEVKDSENGKELCQALLSVEAAVDELISLREKQLEGQRNVQALADNLNKALNYVSDTLPAVSALVRFITTLQGALGDTLMPSYGLAVGPCLGRVRDDFKSSSENRTVEQDLALEVAALVVDVWKSVSAAWPPMVSPEGRGTNTSGWEALSGELSKTMSLMVQSRFLPAVSEALHTIAARLFTAASEKLTNHEENVGKSEEVLTRFSFQGPKEEITSSNRPELIMQLPEFFDFDAGGGDGDELEGSLEALEFEPLEGSVSGSLHPEDELVSVELLPDKSLEPGSALLVKELIDALLECSERTGALATVDSVLYTANFTLEQRRQSLFRACADLAVHQWRHEPALRVWLGEGGIDLLSDAVPAAIGAWTSAELVPNPAETAAIALSVPPHRLLSDLQASLQAVMAAHGDFEHWSDSFGELLNRVAEELSAGAPHTAANVSGCVQACTDWHAASAAHVASLIQLARGVLNFEASREISNYRNSVFDWRRYETLVTSLRDVRDRAEAVEDEARKAESALETLRAEKSEASSALRAAEEIRAKALVHLGRAALPLVKATQKLEPSLRHLALMLEGSASNAARVLARARRTAVRLHTAGLGSLETMNTSDGAHPATEVARLLENPVTTLGALPDAVAALIPCAQMARVELQHGGRGEAAAREQAADIVRIFRVPMKSLAPLVAECSLHVDQENGSLVERARDLFDAMVRDAPRGLEALQRAHGLELLDADGGVVVPPQTCLNSAHLYPPPLPLTVSSARRDAFVERVTKTFERKVLGSTASEENEEASVSRAVEDLICQATDVGQLSRMYEGWMPWV